LDLRFNLNQEQKQKLEQNLVMTPQLQLAIELLQYSSLELKEHVNEELKENPLLEKEEADQLETLENRIDNQYQASYQQYSDDDKQSFENYVKYEPNMYEYLENQLFQVLTADELEIGRYLIGALNEDGFLEEDLSSISKELAVSEVRVEKVLKKINYLDPVGIGARNLQESLLIQLDSLLLNTELAEIIVNDYFKELANNDYHQLFKKIDAKKERIKGAVNLIRTLNTVPGAIFSKEHQAEYIEPDIIVKKVKEEFVIILNQQASPILRINPQYYRMLQQSDQGETRTFLENKYKSAMWLIRSIEQRRITVYKIVKAIVDKQELFFRKGIKHLQPLTMQEIADEIEMHESTVSRATSSKYIQTPCGLFNLKFFFTSGVNNLSSHSIKAIIREYIKRENQQKPLSDQKIVDLLAEKINMKLSRRTVAKYRSEMSIGSSTQRLKKYKREIME